MPITDQQIKIHHDEQWTDHVVIAKPGHGTFVCGVLRFTPAEAEQVRRDLNRLLCRHCGQSGEVQDGDGRTYACRCVEL